MRDTTMTKDEVAFYLSAPRASLSTAQKAAQRRVYNAIGRDMPADVKPKKAPLTKDDRKAIAAKARESMLANIRAAYAELADDEANEGAESEHEGADA